MEHAIILAGGSGTRPWPMSRRNRPKQLLPLVEGRTLLDLALERLAAIFPPSRIWIVTNAELVEPIRAAAPGIPQENILGEPGIRDTSNAIGLACMLVAACDPDARVGIFTADHVIRPLERFAEAVRAGLDELSRTPEALITLGVPPSWPNTALGYIRRGDQVRPGLHRVGQFVEKPDLAKAQQYAASGQYYWNSGMFIWRADTLVGLLERLRPEHAAMLRQAADAWAKAGPAAAGAIYAALPRISIDYAVMEPAASDPACRVLVRELDCQWLDVGSWPAVAQVNQPDGSGNVSAGPVVCLDATGNILMNEDPGRLLAVAGVKDMVVVHSGGVTLVVPQSRAQDVKRLLDLVRASHGDRYD